jgi:hypothetical protein
MVEYWKQLGAWATREKVRIHLFEAFDEPWKGNPTITDPQRPDGKYGAEIHFGWWKRTSNSDPHAFVEKITGKVPGCILNSHIFI